MDKVGVDFNMPEKPILTRNGSIITTTELNPSMTAINADKGTINEYLNGSIFS